MKGVIVTNRSKSTEENSDLKAIDYFKGTHGHIKSFKESLESFLRGNGIDLFIITKKFRLVRGNRKIKEYPRKKYDPNKINKELHEIIPNYDFGVVLLSKKFFLNIFRPGKENDLIKSFPEGSLWGIFTSQSALKTIDDSVVKEKGIDLLTEKKVGVARYTTSFMKEFKENLQNYSFS
ncbi:hypothetical protein AKJ50_00470 [candidate division MSBL1 archaeon SCGC-AAA382A13]|uniref:Uncharacterized protein n=1 Tax=candidate division MSBL1 archaeon SCGC-AAA382A13 TaxID=1698279 RepID=A0A133VGM9_9EURY|nr:hypothetical protein AKJ50_00470 [candidate division MSBL1 archaeon SCGC-AAA382A13]